MSGMVKKSMIFAWLNKYATIIVHIELNVVDAQDPAR
jgi:hypothetical protein